MARRYHHWKRILSSAAIVCAACTIFGCAHNSQVYTGDLPPVLAQDELLRPYQKVAVLEVHRERYGSPTDISPADYNWAYDALRQEAGRIGADAVIFPEVRVEMDSYIVFPSSEIRAKGIAIKFR